MDDDYRPQDEYFEWDDIMVYKGPSGIHDDLKDPLVSGFRPTPGRSFSFDSSDSAGEEDFAWSDASSLSTTPSSLSSTGSLSLRSLKEDKSDAEIDFPSYDDATTCQSCVTIGIDAALALTAPPSPILEPVSDAMASGALPDVDDEPLSRTVSRGEVHVGARDDFDLNIQPFRNVNYLTHDWCEEDIPSTWRYVVSRRADWAETTTRRKSIWRPFNNIPRYENALWRSWAQRRFQLNTVSPDTINWMKSCDETTLYGPFMMTADEFTPSTSVVADAARSTKLRSKTTKKPLLKRPPMSEILLRGSIPTFVSSRISNGETHQTAFQAKPSYDPSVACPGMSVAQRRELTSVARTRAGLSQPKPPKSVKFLNEVEQWEIIKVRVSSKNRRTLKKIASTTLERAAYNLPAPIKTAAPNHWSPDSLWSYNPENSPDKETAEGGWTGIGGEEDEGSLYPAPIRIHKQKKQFPAIPDPPRSKHHASHTRNSAISMGNGSLAQHLSNLKYEEEVDDELDYLIAIASPQGSLSPPTSESSNSGSSEDSIDTSDEDEIPFFGTGDIADEKNARKSGFVTRDAKGVRGMGIGVRIVGEESETERQLYDEMEEYDLVLG